MTVNLLSVQFIDFIPQNSVERITGCKLWFTREPLTNEADRWSNDVVAYRWVDVSDNLYAVASALKPGVTELCYETDGKHTFLTDIQQ